jgi:hypothetical protein
MSEVEEPWTNINFQNSLIEIYENYIYKRIIPDFIELNKSLFPYFQYIGTIGIGKIHINDMNIKEISFDADNYARCVIIEMKFYNEYKEILLFPTLFCVRSQKTNNVVYIKNYSRKFFISNISTISNNKFLKKELNRALSGNKLFFELKNFDNNLIKVINKPTYIIGNITSHENFVKYLIEHVNIKYFKYQYDKCIVFIGEYYNDESFSLMLILKALYPNRIYLITKANESIIVNNIYCSFYSSDEKKTQLSLSNSINENKTKGLSIINQNNFLDKNLLLGAVCSKTIDNDNILGKVTNVYCNEISFRGLYITENEIFIQS